MTQNELRTAVHAALRNWTQQSRHENSYLENLLLIRQKREKLGGSGPTAHRLATNQVLFDGLEALKVQSETGANLLAARFLDGKTLQAIAVQMHLSQDQVKRRQREAISRLTHIIWEQETAVRAQQTHALKSALMPPSYTHLFGIDTQVHHLTQQLISADNPWIVALVGIGGIGKTALADAVVRKVIEQFVFEQVIWLRLEKTAETRTPEALWQQTILMLAERCQLDISTTAPFSEKYAQLRQLLKLMPMLVVIDNLESEQDTAHFAQQLQDLAAPSKFLLTSRVRLPELTAVYTVTLQELAHTDSLQLIKNHAQTIGLTELAQAEDTALAPIYDTIGGNPLAIKLVVGLAGVLSLPQILSNLVSANHKAIADMYKRIYWQAWSVLSENGRLLLEMMPMAADIGMPETQMLAVSGLEESAFWTALTELTTRSLIEVRGTTWERRYGIHRLTETFLHTEVIHWPEDAIT